MKTTIIYWTSTGNTEKMAQLIEKGAVESGKFSEVAVKRVGKSTIEDITKSDIIILGCSAMGVEEIDSSEMEPFILNHKEAFVNKQVALFGSYGWGDGEWMETWETMMNSLGVKLITDSLTVNDMPEGESSQACIDFGKTVAQIV